MRAGLYAIVDTDTLARAALDPVEFTRRVLEAGALAAVQLRAKSLGSGACLALAETLAPLCRAAGVPFFVNDRADVAALAGADGVHLGVTDLPLGEARRIFPSLQLGASSHNDDEVAAALAQGPDYLAFGPVFGTGSKRDPSPTVGLDALRRITTRSPLPVVAIGGITLDNAAQVRAAGARCGAVIAALVVPVTDQSARARALHHALGGR